MGVFDKFLGAVSPPVKKMTLGELADFVGENVDYDAPMTIYCQNGEYACSPNDGPYVMKGNLYGAVVYLYPDPSGHVLRGADFAKAVEELSKRYPPEKSIAFSIHDYNHDQNAIEYCEWGILIDPIGPNRFVLTGKFGTEKSDEDEALQSKPKGLARLKRGRRHHAVALSLSRFAGIGRLCLG